MLLDIDKIEPSRIAVLDSEGNKVTYGEIVQRALDIRSQHEERELRILLVENTAEDVATLIAMIASEKLVPIVLNKKTDETLLENIKSIYGKGNITLHPLLSHLLPTSGSTGSPKLVRHCYENIEAAGTNISAFFELKPEDRPLMVLPLYYTMGLSMVFSHFKVGATVLITGLAMTDAKFWSFMKEEHATSFTGVPYSFHILNLMRFMRMKLPEMELLTQGGGKMPHDLNVKFAEYCRDNGKRWIATYGQSECTARMAYLPAKWALEKVGSIGIAVPNGELSLVDEEGNVITTPHVEGEMCYRGKNVTMGYAQKAEDLALGDERNGFIRTGDLAYFDEDGCYYIVGRMGRFLKLFGMRVGLDECENIVQNDCGCECACVGTDEKMIVYINDESKVQEAKDVLVEKTHIVATSFEVRVIGDIPKNTTGKKQYKMLPVV